MLKEIVISTAAITPIIKLKKKEQLRKNQQKQK